MERPSRAARHRKKTSPDRRLNRLIAVVTVLVLLAAYYIMTVELEPKTPHERPIAEAPVDVVDSDEEEDEEPADEERRVEERPTVDEQPNESVERADEAKPEEEVVIETNDDPTSIISETIEDPNWEPIGTVQRGPHVSMYDGYSDDWKEKKRAIASAVGHDEQSLIYWKVKNGGSNSHAIGIVSTHDEQEKYQVYIEWIDGAGWKPTKVETLRTLQFDY